LKGKRFREFNFVDGVPVGAGLLCEGFTGSQEPQDFPKTVVPQVFPSRDLPAGVTGGGGRAGAGFRSKLISMKAVFYVLNFGKIYAMIKTTVQAENAIWGHICKNSQEAEGMKSQ